MWSQFATIRRTEMLAVTVIVLVAAITPGPNNLVVLRAAARGGAGAAISAIVGIVTGGLVLLGIVVAGAGVVFAAEPGLRLAVTIGGCSYLSWLGLCLIRGAGAKGAEAVRPEGALALFGFQFLNPKAWMMALTTGVADIALWQLAAVFVIVPVACLTLWAACGAALTGVLARPSAAARFDRAMGALLVVSAIGLAVTA
jgi:threonine/homoserine/homoserine lactone efflux protein